MARRRRISINNRRSVPKRTPTLIYIVLALLCAGGLFYSKQNLVKTVTGTVIDAYSGQPLAGVSVTLTNDPRLARTAGVTETVKVSTDNSGLFELNPAVDEYTLSVQTNYYKPLQLKQSGVYTNSLKMVPTLLRGQIKDENGQSVARAQVTLGNTTVESTSDGTFNFPDAPENGTISVRAPGYRRNSVNFTKTVRVDVPLQAFKVKAAYIAPAEIAGPSAFNNVMNTLAQTELTAVVVDVKDEGGRVLFDSKQPLAATLVAGNDRKIPNLPALLKTFQDKKLYTIARIVCFQDPKLTDLKPEWTLKSRSTGKAWADSGGYNWINPYQRDSWEYYLGLAEEAARAGFDEIQFAGLHFPVLGKLSDIEYGLSEGRTSNAQTRTESINGFLKAARDRLSSLGVYTSVSVFGTALVEGGDLNIGMNVGAMAGVVDYISPLIYPIEWEPGAFGIDQPTQKPYELVRQSMLSAKSVLKERLPQLRPWLQDFTRPNLTFGEEQVREEIRAVEEFQKNGGAGWILFNPASKYTTSAIPRS